MKEEESKEMTARSIDPLSLIQVFLCCSYTRHNNGDEFVVFIDERAALVKRLDQRFALDNEDPYKCFAQFFQSDFHFVDEVLSRFGALCFAVIRCWRRSGSDKLAGNVISSFRPFRSSFITPCSIFDIQSDPKYGAIDQ